MLEVSQLKPGRITVDELRILFEIAYHDLTGQPVGVKFLSDHLAVPRSSVSRMVANFLDEGRVVETTAADGRHHPLRLSNNAGKRFRDVAMRLGQAPSDGS